MKFSQRALGPFVLTLMAAGAVAFFALSRVWLTATVRADGLPDSALTVKGSTAHPVAAALALVVLTSALGLLAAGPRLRRALGVFLVLVGMTGVIVVVRSSELTTAFQSALHESPAFVGSNAPTPVEQAAWQWLTVVAFLTAACIGVFTVRWAPQWRMMSARYDRAAASADDVNDPAQLWKVLDQGDDPTL